MRNVSSFIAVFLGAVILGMVQLQWQYAANPTAEGILYLWAEAVGFVIPALVVGGLVALIFRSNRFGGFLTGTALFLGFQMIGTFTNN